MTSLPHYQNYFITLVNKSFRARGEIIESELPVRGFPTVTSRGLELRDDDTAIKLRYSALDPVLDERGRRRFAAAEALAVGRGGVVAVARITGIAPQHDRSRAGGTARRGGARGGAWSGAPEGRRTPGPRGRRSDAARRSRCLGGADDTRRSDGTAAVDRQEPAQSGGRVNGPRNLPRLGRAKFPTLAGVVINRWLGRCLHFWAAGRGAWVAPGWGAAG